MIEGEQVQATIKLLIITSSVFIVKLLALLLCSKEPVSVILLQGQSEAMTTCSVEELPIEQASHAPQRLLDSFQFLKNVIDFINYQVYIVQL